MVSQEIINNLIKENYIYHIGEHNFILPYIYEPHIVTASMVFGFFFIDYLFDYLFWENYIRPVRNNLKEKIINFLKRKR